MTQTHTIQYNGIQLLNNMIQDAQLHVVAQGTHVAPLEDHLVVNQIVKTFLHRSGFMQDGSSDKSTKPKVKKKKVRKTV